MSNNDHLQSVECCSTELAPGPLTEALPLFAVLLAVAWFYSRRNLISGVAKVTSGNRLMVGKHKIRIYAMFGLYPGQPWYDRNGVEFNGGEKSKAALVHKIDGKKVKCWQVPNTPTIYGAKLCRVYLDGEDVAKWMVRNGYALADRFPSRRKLYIRAEKRAKKEDLGIHQGVFDHPRVWYLNKFRNSERVKEILDEIERRDLEDDDLDWYEIAKWGNRVFGDGGAMEFGEWIMDL